MDDHRPLIGSDESGDSESEDDLFDVSLESAADDAKNSLENLDLDMLLEERLGQFGLYQKLIFILVSLPTILCGLQPLVSVFTMIEPKHRCYVPGCDNPSDPNYSDAVHFQNFSIPFHENGDYESCSRFKAVISDSCTKESFGKTIVPCVAYVYDHSVMENTVSMKYDLVCDQSGMAAMSQSIYFLGVLAGASFFGHLGDSIGRRSAFIVTLIQTLTCGFATLAAPSIFYYNILQFLIAMSQVGMFQTCFVMGVELVGPKYRVFCSVVLSLICGLGGPYLSAIAYYLRDWEKMTLAYMVPSLLFLTYYFFLPKSVRWLIANHRCDEAEAELQRVAKWNRVQPLTRKDFKLCTKKADVEVKETFGDLLRRPKLIKRLAIVFLCWIVVVLTYYALSLSASTLGGDVFVNFTLLALIEFPGCGISYFGMQHWGRKPTMIASLFTPGFACLISSFLPKSYTSLHMILFLVGKFGASASFTTVYLYTNELFPTSVRNLCLGLSSMTGRFGAIVAPYIKEIGSGSDQDWIPLAIYGVCGLVSGSAVFFLQETKGKALPRTLDEAEAESQVSLSMEDLKLNIKRRRPKNF